MKKGEWKKSTLRKKAKKLTDNQLRSFHASMHSKTGSKSVSNTLKLAGAKLTVSDVRAVLKDEMNTRKKRKQK